MLTDPNPLHNLESRVSFDRRVQQTRSTFGLAFFEFLPIKFKVSSVRPPSSLLLVALLLQASWEAPIIRVPECESELSYLSLKLHKM